MLINCICISLGVLRLFRGVSGVIYINVCVICTSIVLCCLYVLILGRKFLDNLYFDYRV